MYSLPLDHWPPMNPWRSHAYGVSIVFVCNSSLGISFGTRENFLDALRTRNSHVQHFFLFKYYFYVTFFLYKWCGNTWEITGDQKQCIYTRISHICVFVWYLCWFIHNVLRFTPVLLNMKVTQEILGYETNVSPDKERRIERSLLMHCAGRKSCMCLPILCKLCEWSNEVNIRRDTGISCVRHLNITRVNHLVLCVGFIHMFFKVKHAFGDHIQETIVVNGWPS